MKVQDLAEKNGKTTKAIQANRVFAVQENEQVNGNGKRRYAKISLDQKQRVFLHALETTEHPPNDSYLLKHSDVMKLVDISHRLAFIELSFEDQKLGRLLISLAPDTNFARQFSLLCTGELGPSYARTNILKVMYQGEWTESVFFGDYESNDGEGGKALVAGPNWATEHTHKIYKRPWKAGVVGGWGWEEERACQFAIHTRNCDGFELPGCFGVVEDGLGILTEALSQQKDITEVCISDCGIILSQ
ncbi:uncharacterized protein LOC135199839 [Macrobrachium nipponense]|uniref:uncharacterized protein LOC135199839 n=1 Tax=Macrobrachium nipponense TaxID=159736 RepID=UPI0030C836E2